MYSLNKVYGKSLWIKASAKCINLNVNLPISDNRESFLSHFNYFHCHFILIIIMHAPNDFHINLVVTGILYNITI